MQQKKTVGIFQNQLIAAVLATGLLFAGATSTSAQGTVIAKGGAGESGASAILHYEATGNSPFIVVLSTVDTSLCRNTGAIAVLVVNGGPVAHGNITPMGSSIQAEVRPGDNVIAIVHTIPLFNSIACVRLGELDVEMEERVLE